MSYNKENKPKEKTVKKTTPVKKTEVKATPVKRYNNKRKSKTLIGNRESDKESSRVGVAGLRTLGNSMLKIARKKY